MPKAKKTTTEESKSPKISNASAAATVVSKTQVSVSTPSPTTLLSTPKAPSDGEVILTDAEGRRYCRATDCDQISNVDGYCRYHYLYFWKKIQNRKRILADGKLERYIEELTARYVDKHIELLRKDLRTEKDFMAALRELELDPGTDDSDEGDEEETKSYIDEIRGIGTSEEVGTTDDEY